MRVTNPCISLFLALFLINSGGQAVAADSCKPFSTQLATTASPPQVTSAYSSLAKILASVPETSDVILLGDSLLAGWNPTLATDIPGKNIWNFSVGNDRTQHALWRMDKLKPGEQKTKAVIVLLGTNNLVDGGMDGCGIYEGVKAVVKKAQILWKGAPIFVFTVPPRGADFQQKDEDRKYLNSKILNISSEMKGVYPIVINDSEFTCSNYGKPALAQNAMYCTPDAVYRCVNYKDDNIHFQAPAFQYLKREISDASVKALGKDILQ